MEFAEYLAKKRNQVLERWFTLTLAVFPQDSLKLLSDVKDSFSNPVGCTLFSALKVILDVLLSGENVMKAHPELSNVIKIFSIQNLPASRAVEFLFFLKQTIKEESKQDIARYYPEIQTYYEKIDQLVLIAFDIYIQCKEKICDIKISEFKSHNMMLYKMLKNE